MPPAPDGTLRLHRLATDGLQHVRDRYTRVVMRAQPSAGVGFVHQAVLTFCPGRRGKRPLDVRLREGGDAVVTAGVEPRDRLEEGKPCLAQEDITLELRAPSLGHSSADQGLVSATQIPQGGLIAVSGCDYKVAVG
jgi:hypothetical protein